jgi:uncharacterized protein (TIGR02145 family)
MLKNISFVAVLAGIVGLFLLLGCNGGGDDNPTNNNQGTPSITSGSFKDSRDGQTYKTVKVGNQNWMAQNLNYLPSTMYENDFSTDSSWCYGNLESNCAKYGRLYTWLGAHGGCPAGWRLPTWYDWKDFVIQLGGFQIGTTGKKLKSKMGWNENGNGTDDIGFNALPGGSYVNCPECRYFLNIGQYGYWWGTNTPEDIPGNRPSRVSLSYEDDQVDLDVTGLGNVHSVRCIQK